MIEKMLEMKELYNQIRKESGVIAVYNDTCYDLGFQICDIEEFITLVSKEKLSIISRYYKGNYHINTEPVDGIFLIIVATKEEKEKIFNDTL